VSDKLKAGSGSVPLEQKVIDATLERLGVSVDPQTRTVNEGGADGSKVKGGMEGLKKAAAATGDPAVIDLEDLGAIRERFSMPSLERAKKWLVGKGDAKVAQAKINGASMSLKGAAENLAQFVDTSLASESINLANLAGVFRWLEKAAGDLKAALGDDALAHATPSQIKALRESYRELLDTLAEKGPGFQVLVNSGYLPQARKMAEWHNAQGIGGRLFGGVPVTAMMEIQEHIAKFSSVNKQLLDQADLFRPFAPGEASKVSGSPLEQKGKRFVAFLKGAVEASSDKGRFHESACHANRFHPHTFLMTSVFGAVSQDLGIGEVGSSYGYAHEKSAAARLELEKTGHPTELIKEALERVDQLYHAAAKKAGTNLMALTGTQIADLLPEGQEHYAVAVHWYSAKLNSQFE
jgi:hypothetical protein